MSREEGLELIRRYDGKCHPKYIKALTDYLEITEEEFWDVAERYRGIEFFDRDDAGVWHLKEELYR